MSSIALPAKELGKLESKAKYEKEKEIQQRIDAEKRARMNYTFFIIVLMILFITALFYYRYFLQKRTNKILSEQNEEIIAQNEQISQQRDELNTAYAKLKELDEFKESLSGMIVHDLKNPLNIIIGLSAKQILNESDQLAIHQAAKQMLNLTLNILDVQKFEQASMKIETQDVSLYDLVQDALYQVSLLASEKNIHLSINIDTTIGVLADAELVVRVLMNLLTNAIKYTPNNGQIIIASEENNQRQVVISVSDNGQGIPPDKLHSIFDKFSQVEAKKSGVVRSTGLGLTFCKMVIETHGGLIWVSSELNKGTTFYFSLHKSATRFEDVPVNQPALETNNAPLWTNEDLKHFQSILPDLEQLDVYEGSEVIRILNDLPPSQALDHWKKEMENALFSSNQEVFERLLKKHQEIQLS